MGDTSYNSYFFRIMLFYLLHSFSNIITKSVLRFEPWDLVNAVQKLYHWVAQASLEVTDCIANTGLGLLVLLHQPSQIS